MRPLEQRPFFTPISPLQDKSETSDHQVKRLDWFLFDYRIACKAFEDQMRRHILRSDSMTIQQYDMISHLIKCIFDLIENMFKQLDSRVPSQIHVNVEDEEQLRRVESDIDAESLSDHEGVSIIYDEDTPQYHTNDSDILESEDENVDISLSDISDDDNFSEYTPNSSETDESAAVGWKDWDKMNKSLCTPIKEDDQFCKTYRESKCPVCMTDLNGQISVLLDCCHFVHTKCFDQLKVKTKQICPICKEMVSDVKSLSQHCASPLIKMDNSHVRDIVRDVQSVPQSPNRYMNIHGSVFPQKEPFKRRLFEEPQASTSGETENLEVNHIPEEALRKKLINIYIKANKELFNQKLPDRVTISFRGITSRSGRIVSGNNQIRIVMRYFKDTNPLSLVTVLLNLMKQDYAKRYGQDSISKDLDEVIRQEIEKWQRELLLFFS